MTENKPAEAPVANPRETKRQMAQSRKAHPAGSKRPSTTARAPKKAASTTTPVVEKVTYAATGRGGKVRQSASATPLVAAVDVKISGRNDAAFASGVVVAFYASREKAQKAADDINGGAAGATWTEAIVVPVEVA